MLNVNSINKMLNRYKKIFFPKFLANKFYRKMSYVHNKYFKTFIYDTRKLFYIKFPIMFYSILIS